MTLVAYMARVSNPANQDNKETAPKLIRYLMQNQHWSPFEMVNACVEIECTRDIARQILRHRSFTFQEFCVAGDTLVTLELPNAVAKGKRAAYKRSIDHLYSLQQKGKLPTFVRVYDETSETFVVTKIKEVFKTGVKPVFKVTLANGKTITATKEHKFLTSDGFQTMEDSLGLKLVGNTATMSKDCFYACNGVEVYKDYNWMQNTKHCSISNKMGLSYIADKANVSTHTIRKWLKHHGLSFTKKEVAQYTSAWNKGLRGYKNGPHSAETIEKMRNAARKGSASNLWRGGVSRSERLKIADWANSLRSEFLHKANHKCNRCDSSENLQLHHIQTVAERPDLACDKENIEVLCKKCHAEHHRLSGDTKTWRQKSKGNTLTVEWSKVVSVEYAGEQMTYDMEVDHESHNYVGNGIVTHNSQRYAQVDSFAVCEPRMQDVKNRQNSIPVQDRELQRFWEEQQTDVLIAAKKAYAAALNSGIAKEVARKVLPEGLTMSRMYMNGSLRSWLHYIQIRTDEATQKEHREVAQAICSVIAPVFPSTFAALDNMT
jgi:thymidylate synthase (FAD)